jgi:uncharacterized damage-inducible protein DinB
MTTTTLELCITRRKAEKPTFVRVFKALPPDQLAYRPHARSRTAAEVAWTIASEEADLATILDTGKVDFNESAPPATLSDILAAYERNSAAVDERLRTLDLGRWETTKGQFLMGGVPVWEATLCDFTWGFLLDAVHHRGQLSAYIRPMGGKVPSIYGPSGDASGDDPGQ